MTTKLVTVPTSDTATPMAALAASGDAVSAVREALPCSNCARLSWTDVLTTVLPHAVSRLVGQLALLQSAPFSFNNS